MKKIDVKGIAIKTAGIGAGAYVSVKLNKIEFIKKQKPALRGAIKMALGAFLPVFLAKGKKADIIGNVGDGMIAGGAIELATAFDDKLATDLTESVAGIGNMPTMGQVVFDESYTSGVGATPVMGSTDEGMVIDE
jgi:hypothetical protein